MSRLALISDIHGNGVEALTTATEAMPQPTWASDLERGIRRWNAGAAA